MVPGGRLNPIPAPRLDFSSILLTLGGHLKSLFSIRNYSEIHTELVIRMESAVRDSWLYPKNDPSKALMVSLVFSLRINATRQSILSWNVIIIKGAENLVNPLLQRQTTLVDELWRLATELVLRWNIINVNVYQSTPESDDLDTVRFDVFAEVKELVIPVVDAPLLAYDRVLRNS